MTVFKIYVHGISDDNMVFRSDVPTSLTEYGDSILSPKLKKETNKADSFEFMILPNNEYYDIFEKKKTFVFLTRNDECIFRGRVADVKTDLFKQRTITCEGDLAFLTDSVLSPNKKTNKSNAGSTKKQKNETVYSRDGGEPYNSTSKDTIKMSPEAYFRSCIGVHNGQMTDQAKRFTVGWVTVNDSDKTEYFERTSYQDTSSTISSDLLSVYGGVLRTRYENGQAYIDWLEEYTDTGNQEIRFGINLIDIDQEAPTDEIWSVLLPTGEENCTIASANNGNLFLVNDNAVTRYGYIVHHHAFSNVKKADKLLEKAQKYMRTHCKVYPDNLNIKALDLELIGESDDPLELGEKIRVKSTPHGLDKTMACISMELDLFNPENNSYTIGTIMPPDKEKKKEPISEKHRSSHNSSSRGIGSNANAISGLQNDVNVNANNINVNAENIAVNALNIAVNAENIAVVAKNISIAAETIDIKAQQLTATFEEETGNLKGTIETSAAGIKSVFSDNTTGLSSYFSQEAGKIAAGIQSAQGDIESKIELTENNITQSINSTIYGENGVVSDYESKIDVSKTSIIASVIGEDADPSKPDTWKSGSMLTLSRDYMYAALFGGGSNVDPKNPSTWDLGSYMGLSRNKIMMAVFGSNEWTNQKSLFEVTDTGIKARVAKGEVISSINQTAESITISASKIDLQGLVNATELTSKFATITDLTTTNTNITNLTSGTAQATHLSAVTVSAETLQVYRQAGAASEYKKFYVSMVQRGDSTYYNSDYILSTNSSGILDLRHSHSCTTNSDGTITLGGAVAAGSGGSFRIADTKAYKDGVSAAYTSGYVDGVPNDSTWAIPIYSNSKNWQMVAVSDDNDGVKDAVSFKVWFDDNSGAQHTHTFTRIPCWDVYNAGYGDGHTAGYNSVSAASASVSPYGVGVATMGSSGKNDEMSMYVDVTLENGKSAIHQLTGIVAYPVYNEGYSDGHTDGYNSVYASSASLTPYGVGTATRGSSGRYDEMSTYVTVSLENGKSSVLQLNGIVAYPVYNEGRKDCVSDCICTGVRVNSDGSADVYIDWNDNKATKHVAHGNVIDNHS